MQTTTNRAEQQARWLLWQMNGVTVDGDTDVHTQPPMPPELLMTMPPEPRHSPYDAVIRRMQQAGQRTGAYSPVS